jgi:prolyl oligopeptidase
VKLSVIAMTAILLGAPATPADDPNQWLEDVTGDKPLAWVKARNAESTDELTKPADFDAMRAKLLAILDSKEKIPLVAKRGPYYYNFWRDEKNKRGLLRRTTLDEYKKADPKWETVLDIDQLAEKEKENWVYHGSKFLEPSYERAMLMLSRGGADANVVREFDPVAKEFVKGGFELPEAKSDVDWRDRDTLLVGTDFGPGSLTDSGYPRQIKVWKRGTKLADATLLFEGQKADVSAGAGVDHTKGFEREFVSRSPSFFESETNLVKDGKIVKIDKPIDAEFSTHREWALIKLRSNWDVGGKTYKAGSLLANRFDDYMKGDRKFDVLFEPTDRTSLENYSGTLHHIILNSLDTVRSRVTILTCKDGKWERQEMPGLPPMAAASASPVDADEGDEYWLTVEDFLTPQTLALGTAGGGPAEKLKSAPSFFDAKGLEITQHEATSKDGTKVPYFQIARAGLKLEGTAPTLLYGYGGFEVSMTPGYRALAGAAWMEKGGVYVVANIRGGGEFGPAWHKAALKDKRHRAYEDFVAVADDLVARKVTSKEHLGIQGGSNGGLLMGNMLTLYPEHFGAIVCQVPLLDMKRYSHLLAGASWMAEYGDPDKPEEWQYIQTFSPYHNVKKDVKYPRTLFTTSTRDDRVHPGHARKMVAKLKEVGADVIYYENVEGGHGGAADNKQKAFMDSLAYSFLWKQLK